MSLRSNYGNENKVTDTKLSVRYASEIAKVTDTGVIYHVTRYASKSYKYIGMSEDGASACKDALEAKYYRQYAKYELDGEKILARFAFCCTAEIVPQHVEGDNWACVVTVNEQDDIYTRQEARTLEQCRAQFSFAEVRDYDEDVPVADGLAIIQAVFDNPSQIVRVYYNTNISGFVADASHLILEYYRKADDEWVQVDSSNVRYSDSLVEADTVERPFWRLKYVAEAGAAPILSNEVEPIEDPSKVALRLTRCSLDILNAVQSFEYEHDIDIQLIANHITPEWYNEATAEWVPVTSGIFIRGEVYIEIRPPDPEPQTWRLHFQNGSINYYSQAVRSSGEGASAYPIEITQAKIVDGASYRTCELHVTTPIPFATLRKNEWLWAYITPENSYGFPVSIASEGIGRYVLMFENGKRDASFGVDGSSFQLQACQLQGRPGIASNVVTPEVVPPDIVITGISNVQLGRQIDFDFNLSEQIDPTRLELYRFDEVSVKGLDDDKWGKVDSVGFSDHMITPTDDGLFKIAYVDVNGAEHWSEPFAGPNANYIDFDEFKKIDGGRLRATYVAKPNITSSDVTLYAYFEGGTYSSITDGVTRVENSLDFNPVDGAIGYFLLSIYGTSSTTRIPEA